MTEHTRPLSARGLVSELRKRSPLGRRARGAPHWVRRGPNRGGGACAGLTRRPNVERAANCRAAQGQPFQEAPASPAPAAGAREDLQGCRWGKGVGLKSS